MRITVVGAGQMGVKIAGELAYHGHRVNIFDTNVDNLNKVNEILENDRRELHEDGLLPQAKFIGQVYCMSRLEEAIRDAQLILETVFEDVEVKKDIFDRISHCCDNRAIIASNTLRIDINEIVDRALNKERTLGLRFLFPVYCIPEVEVNPTTETSNETIETIRQILEKMGKTMFFRSGKNPLVLSEGQREERRQARKREISESCGVGIFTSTIPALHRSQAQLNEAAANNPSEPDSDCAICMERLRDCLFMPCQHLVVCYQCGQMLQTRADACPICRKDISHTVKVYHT